MDDARISQLKVAAPLSGSEYIPITQLQTSTNVLRTLYTDANAFKDFVFDEAADLFCPPGLIISYAGSVSSVDAPSGWLLCDGRSVMRSTYSKLFSKIGTTYGSINDKSFNLPNLKGRVVMGYCDTTASTNLSSVFNSYNDDYIQYGLRFRSSSNTYLSRTPTIAGNRRIWTWSGWINRRTIGTGDSIFHWGSTQNDFVSIAFANTNILACQNAAGNVVTDQLQTTQTFTDTSKWYHIVVACDTTQTFDTNRIKIYVDGAQITSFSIATYPAINFQTYVNSTQPVFIGKNSTSGIQLFDGALAEINFIDGQALAASNFGQTNACGAWIPKTYTGTYGTNGFYLNFADRSAMTATTIGNDASLNNNNWTPNNLTLNDAINFKATPNDGAPTVAVGSTGGVFNHQLIGSQIPINQTQITFGNIPSAPQTSSSIVQGTNNTSALPLNNTKPYMVMNYIIRY
jgi:microcystin-dependent protein